MSEEKKNSNMTIEKQLNINQLPVPFYLHEMIKEFVFQDRAFYEAKIRTKENMKLTLYAIKHGLYYFRPNFPDWTWSSWTMRTRGIEIGAVNCRKCGDFVFLPVRPRPNGRLYCDRISCNCEEQRDTVEDQSTLYGGNPRNLNEFYY